MNPDSSIRKPPFVLSRFQSDRINAPLSDRSFWLLSDPDEILMGKGKDLLQALERIEKRGEWFGFLGYEIGEITEEVEPRTDRGWGLPDFWFGRFTKRERVTPHTPANSSQITGGVTASLSRTEYLKRLISIRRYLEEGDIYQANLSVEFKADTDNDPMDLFLNLTEVSQASHSCYLDSGDWKILSVSPELFLHIDLGSIVTRPIKGTIGKSGETTRDRESLEWLLKSPKNLAELLMIVDLERNDLGRLCKFGSVRVDRFPEVLELPHLYHLLATVRGDLRDGLSLFDIISATFPGGSISGAPKRRALEIIRELEPHSRGPYCGAMGYLSKNQSNLNLAIRTAVWKEGRVGFWGGGGIVFDHDPESEMKEIIAKLDPFLRVLRIDPHGFW